MTKIEKQIRGGLPQVGYAPYGQVHAHSTGNPSSTVQNEADYMNRKDINSGFYTHVVGNGRIIQVANVNRGAWDVGGGFNQWGYASVELIESHKNKAEFERDYKIYINLLRDLAKEAGIPIKVDSGNMGILSHAYCTANQPSNGSDHIDPYPYLAKWGVSKEQFKKDIENGVGGLSPEPPKTVDKKDIIDVSNMGKVSKKDKRYQIIETGRFSKESKQLEKIEKWCKNHRWNYNLIKSKDGRVVLRTGKLHIDSRNKIEFEVMLSEMNLYYKVTY